MLLTAKALHWILTAGPKPQISILFSFSKRWEEFTVLLRSWLLLISWTLLNSQQPYWKETQIVRRLNWFSFS
jgi:hypothetical protein